MKSSSTKNWAPMPKAWHETRHSIEDLDIPVVVLGEISNAPHFVTFSSDAQMIGEISGLIVRYLKPAPGMDSLYYICISVPDWNDRVIPALIKHNMVYVLYDMKTTEVQTLYPGLFPVIIEPASEPSPVSDANPIAPDADFLDHAAFDDDEQTAIQDSEQAGIWASVPSNVIDRLNEQLERIDRDAANKRNIFQRTLNTVRQLEETKGTLNDGIYLSHLADRIRAWIEAAQNNHLPIALEKLKTRADFEAILSTSKYTGMESGTGKVLKRLGFTNDDDYQEARAWFMSFASPVPGDWRITRDEQFVLSLAEVRLNQIGNNGYFPTMPPALEELRHHFEPFAGMRVLEPSAGDGSLARWMREMATESGIDFNAYTIDCIERSYSLSDLLKDQDFYVIGDDFTTVMPNAEQSCSYDYVVMNPPFEKGQDCEHINIAYTRWLKPGGKLIAICAGETVGKTSTKAFRAFNEWLKETDFQVFDLPNDSFKPYTNYKAKLLVIDKPEVLFTEVIEEEPQTEPAVPPYNPETYTGAIGDEDGVYVYEELFGEAPVQTPTIYDFPADVVFAVRDALMSEIAQRNANWQTDYPELKDAFEALTNEIGVMLIAETGESVDTDDLPFDETVKDKPNMEDELRSEKRTWETGELLRIIKNDQRLYGIVLDELKKAIRFQLHRDRPNRDIIPARMANTVREVVAEDKTIDLIKRGEGSVSGRRFLKTKVDYQDIAETLMGWHPLPQRQIEFLEALAHQQPVSQNGATRKALRDKGLITLEDEWDKIRLTARGGLYLACEHSIMKELGPKPANPDAAIQVMGDVWRGMSQDARDEAIQEWESIPELQTSWHPSKSPMWLVMSENEQAAAIREWELLSDEEKRSLTE